MAIVSALVQRFIPQTSISRWPVLLPAIVIGVFIPVSQRGITAATIPAKTSFPIATYEGTHERHATIPLNERTGVQPFGATVVVRHEKLTLHIEPILTFVSTSPDRFWTLFSPDRPNPIRLDKLRRWPGGFAANYLSDFRSHLEVDTAGAEVRINTVSELPQPIYSHLNSYANFYLYGDQPIAIAFSPRGERFAVLPSDYPIGRPARFACLKPNGRFEVVEASSGEKGPFNLLAVEELQREEPLTITLFDGEQPAFEIVLHDWSAQASTQLSPTAGWGMPENAIEFSLSDAGNVAMISVTLAGTSVGRGWDSVGHAPGVYRNRMTVRVLPTR